MFRCLCLLIGLHWFSLCCRVSLVLVMVACLCVRCSCFALHVVLVSLVLVSLMHFVAAVCLLGFGICRWFRDLCLFRLLLCVVAVFVSVARLVF